MTRYDAIGTGYSRYRVPDVRIAAHLSGALGDAASVLNVGAGTGSYEPADRHVVAVEPSATMIAQRPAGAAPVVQAHAESLPFADGEFDAALAVLTLHHWSDWRRGIAEVARVARSVVVLTWDPAHDGFWLTRDYVPDLLALDQRIFPPLAALASALGGADIRPVPVPHDCTDGFTSAYWRRPEAYLDPDVRAAMSSFARVETAAPGLARLADDLDSGRWHDRYGHLLDEDTLDAGYRLVVHRPGAAEVPATSPANTVVLNGTQDERTSPGQARQRAETINRRGGKARVIVYPNYGHQTPVEVRDRDVDPFANRVLRADSTSR